MFQGQQTAIRSYLKLRNSVGSLLGNIHKKIFGPKLFKMFKAMREVLMAGDTNRRSSVWLNCLKRQAWGIAGHVSGSSDYLSINLKTSCRTNPVTIICSYTKVNISRQATLLYLTQPFGFCNLTGLSNKAEASITASKYRSLVAF